MKLTEILAKHARGEVDRGIGEALVEVAEAVLLHEKVGQVQVTFKVEKNGRMVAVSADVKSKIPKGTPEQSLWYANDGELSKQDPWQMSLPMERDTQRVDPGTGEIRRVDDDTIEGRVIDDE